MAEIGRVDPSRREVSGLNPSVDPRAFGAGVGMALRGMGQELAGLAQTRVQQEVAATSMDEAYKARQDKLESAALRTELIRLDNELTRGLSERYDSAPAGAPNFTNDSQAWAQTQLEDFRRRVPERLRPEFDAQIESILQEKTNSAFRLQVSAENAEFTKTVGDLQAQATEAILTAVITDPAQLDEIEGKWIDNLTELMKSSPMDAQASRDLSEQLSVAISSAKMVRLVQEEALDNASTGTVPDTLEIVQGRVRADGPVAAGLPAAAAGFLNAVSGKESGGFYNILYSPSGQRFFGDFSAHPNDPATIASGPHAGKPSSAAGRYQFIKATWDSVASELGLTDFSPESQDRGAWYLAQREYERVTGRNLLAVLESGNQPAIIAAKRVLEGTWEGLKNLPDNEFINTIAGATGTPSSLLYDEEFSHIPRDQRFAILQDGLQQAQTIRTQMAAEAEAARNLQIETLKQGLFDGSMGMQEYVKANEQLRFSVDEQEAMLKVYRDNQTQRYNAEQMLNNIDDPLFNFDPTSTEHQAMASALFSQSKFGERLLEGDEEYVNTMLLPTIERANGYIPDNVVGQLSQQMASQNPQQARFALTTLSKLFAQSPEGFDRAFSDQVTNQVAFFNAAQGALPQEEILSYIRDQGNPMLKQRRDATTAVYREALKNSPADFDPQQIASDLGADGIPMGSGQVLSAEFNAIYNYQLSLLGDHGKARDAAITVLGSRWGTTNIGGATRLIKYPPEKMYPPFNGNHDWIQQQLLSEFPALNGQRYELISDPVTDAQRRNGTPPSYTIVKYDEWGLPSPLRVTDHVNGRGGDPSIPIRWYPEITPKMVEDLYIQRQSVAPTEPLMSPGTAVVPPMPRVSGLMDRVNRLGGTLGSEMIDMVSPDNPRPQGGPQNYTEWRKLSRAEKRALNLDFTRLDAIRYFGLWGSNLEDK